MAKAASVNPGRGVRTGELRDEPQANETVPSPFPLRLPRKPPRPTRRRVAAGPAPGRGPLGVEAGSPERRATDVSDQEEAPGVAAESVAARSAAAEGAVAEGAVAESAAAESAAAESVEEAPAAATDDAAPPAVLPDEAPLAAATGTAASRRASAAPRAPAAPPPAAGGWPARGFGVTSRRPPPATQPGAVRGWPAQGFGVASRLGERAAPGAAAPAPDRNRPVVKVSMERAAAAAYRPPSAPEALSVAPAIRAAAAPPAPIHRPWPSAPPARTLSPAAPAAAPARPTRSVAISSLARPPADEATPVLASSRNRKPAPPCTPLPALRLPPTGARLVQLEDLSVPACAARVEAAVSRIPGVEEAEASAGTGLLAVRPASVDEAALREAVAAAGHRVAEAGDPGAIRRPLVAAALATGAGLAAWALRALTGSPAAGALLAAAAVAAAWPALRPALRHALRGRVGAELLPLASALVVLVGVLAGADVRPEAATAPLVVHLLALAGAAALRTRARAAIDRLAAALPEGAGPKVGARLELPSGATVPADGRLLAAAPVDETPLGGTTAERVAGEAVVAGTRVPEGATIEVVAPADRSLARRALAVARRAAATHADPGRRERFALLFPLAVLAGAVAGGILGGLGTAAAVLGAATPLALAAGVPLALAAGLGRAVSLGAVPRSVEALLRAGGLRVAVLDRTTSLARGAAAVTDFVARPGHEPLAALRLAAAAEVGTDHPIARALSRHAGDVGLLLPAAADVRRAPGRGLRARVEGHEVAVGSGPYLASLELEAGPLAQAAAELAGRGRTPVLVAVDGLVVAVAGVADSPRESARRALGRLELRGIDLVLAGGDAVPAVKWLARALGLEASAGKGDLAGDGKRELVAKARAAGATALVTGAAADVPALAAADLGVAVDGGPEAEAAAAALLVRPDPVAVADLVEAGRTTRLAATAAGGLAVAGNVAGLALALSGVVGPLGAAALALATTALALGAAAAPALLPID